MDLDLRHALEAGGFVDLDAIVAFGDIVDRYDAGAVNANSAVNEMRAKKPHFFVDICVMDDSKFSAADAQIRQGLREGESGAGMPCAPGLDYGRLSDADFKRAESALRRSLAGHPNGPDQSYARSLLARQKAEDNAMGRGS